MARPTLQNVLSLPDPQLSYNWSISIPRIPGVADTRQISYRAISTSIPGTTIEAANWEAHGVRLQSAGRRRYDDTWEFTVVEMRDASTRDMIIAWLEYARSWTSNTGAFKSEYAVPAILTLYDDKSAPTREIKLTNAWPSGIGAVQLSQSAEVVQYQITLAFDYFEDVEPAT